MNTEFIWLAAPITFVVSMLLTRFLIPYLQTAGILDEPNQRSLHSDLIPRAGGIAIVASFLLAVLLILNKSSLHYHNLIVLMTTSLSIALIGLADDIKSLSALKRLALYILVITVTLYFLSVPAFAMTAELRWLFYFLEFGFVLWFLNLFNFMDGIDGIAAIEATSVSVLGALILAFHAPGHEMILILMCLAAASGGFLIWNFPPARVFMGDVASGFLGFVLASIALITWIDGSLNAWVWLILFAVFLIDASLTLFRRSLRKHLPLRAHCDHSYQRAVRMLQERSHDRTQAHRTVSLTTLAINLLWLAPLAFWASLYPAAGWLLFALASTPLIISGWMLGAGTEELAT